MAAEQDKKLQEEIASEDIDAVLNLLENFGHSEESRFKVVMSDELAQGKAQKQYHYGRCDVGSPWAKGTPFDVLEERDGAIEDVTEIDPRRFRDAGRNGCE